MRVDFTFDKELVDASEYTMADIYGTIKRDLPQVIFRVCLITKFSHLLGEGEKMILQICG